MDILIAALVGVVAGLIATRLYYDRVLAKLKRTEENARAKLADKIR